MARKKVLFINTIFIIFSLFCSANSSKLNVPRVLLPIFNDISTNFTLEVTEGGCYKWTTSRLDLVQLISSEHNADQDCSSRVVVSTISKERNRNTAIVLAEDIYTGQVLRCDVILDVISSLNIVTTTRELFMEEAPEAFEVRASDDQGNEFTTLEGVEFEWTLGKPDISVLRFITFRDSPYETPPTVQAFEEAGKQGHIVLLEGVKTGSAKVSVRLPHPEYKKLDGIEVSLMVIANLIIEPSDIYILRGDVVHYKILQVKHGRLEEIKLPSSQYFLVSENPDIGLIEKKSGYLTGLNIGKTRVFLHDSNVIEDSGLKLPSATVNVQYPARISLTLMPQKNWAVMLGDHHDIVVELFASDDHKIHLGEGVNFKTVVDETYFLPSFRTSNGSFISGTAMQQGSTEVQTTLVSVVSTKLGTVNLEPQLTASVEIQIYPRITLNPEEVILPWDPEVKPRYDVELKALGGDGKFLWSTSNHSIGVVTQTGFVRTHWHGQFDICVSMTRNHHNRQCARFHIIPPSILEIVEFVMEAEIGTPIFLNIAVFAERPGPGDKKIKVPFSNCKELPFVIKPSDANFFYNESAVGETVGMSCVSLAVGSLLPGTSRVSVMYKRDDINLEQSVSVSAYRPLKLLHPASGETVLALGTSRYLIFGGGPRPWAGRSSEHKVTIESSHPSIVEFVDSTKELRSPNSMDTYIVKVNCKDLGEATITLKLFNKPPVAKCKHQESIATARVVCANPQFICLQPEIKVPDTSSCPMDLSSERVIVQSYTNVDLFVKLKDSVGRTFDNISSLEFKWESNPLNLASIQNKDGVFEKTYTEENVLLPNKSYQIVKPESQIGSIVVQATVVGYKSAVLKSHNVKTNPSLDHITNSITLYLVDDTHVLPNKTSVYNHPLNKHKLSVMQGSGYNELSLSSEDIADVMYNEALRQIEITPKQPGELRLSIRDLCLKSPPVDVVVSIVYAASIRVEMFDRVEIGKCIEAVIKFYDEFDNLMPLPKLEYLDMRHSMGNNRILHLKIATENPNEKWGVGEIHYHVLGVELGDTKLVFAAGRGDKEVNSNPIDVQVFSPLKIYPKNTTLLIGSILQLNHQGGPQPDTNIEYAIESQNIADISVHGVLHALDIGHTKVTARSVSINPATGRKVTNSQDSVDIYVIPLVGIKLSSPLTRFVQGAIVPIWVTGLPEKLSALLLGSMDPPLSFSWDTRCSDVLTLHGVFAPVGVHETDLNKISVRAKGTRPGHCTVSLNVTVPGATAGQPKKKQIVFSSTLDVEVIDGFHLTSLSKITGKSILMAPFSKLKLSTNKDGYTVLKYSVHGEEQGEADRRSVIIPRAIVSVSNTGVISSHNIIGRAMVVITVRDELGLKQTLSVVINVKPIHYMLLSASTEWLVPLGDGVSVVPLGSQFKLVASYHDNTGAVFSAAQCDLFHKASRLDLIEFQRNADNTSFCGSTMEEGTTVMKVWADNCFKSADYIQISSGQLVKPQTSYVTSGDILCLWSPAVNKQGSYGSWQAEPDNAIQMDPNTGIGVITSGQPTKVYINYDLTPSAKIALSVEPISEVSFQFDTAKILSNTPGNIFPVPLLLKDLKNPSKKSNLYTGWQCETDLVAQIKQFPFSCEIEFDSCNQTPSIHSVLSVEPGFNIDTGLYSCNISPSSSITANSSMIKSDVILRVTTNNGVPSEPLTVKFLPSVFIQNKELIMTDSLTTNLVIAGLPEVLDQISVEPYDSALIDVSAPSSVSPNIVDYEVYLVDYHWKLEELEDPMSVTVISKLTNQVVKVKVKMSSDKVSSSFCSMRQMGSPLGNFMFEYKQTIVILISMCILFFVTFYAYSHYMQPVINVNVGAGADAQAQQRCALVCSPGRRVNFPGDRSMLLNPASPTAGGSSIKRTVGCTSATCANRSMNSSTNSPTMRYGTGEVINRSLGNSPELRRNRSFL